MLTLSETMRHGYAMAEKYSKAAWRQGGKEGCAAVEARIAPRRRPLSDAEGERFPALRIAAGVASVLSFIAFIPMSIEDWSTGMVNLPYKGRG